MPNPGALWNAGEMLENFRLRVFRAVADHLSFRKAGEQLYLSQPAITLQIKTLEDEVGAKLLERRATGVTLTEAGKSLLHHAIQLAKLAEEAENALTQLRGEASGELFLGASTTIAQYVLPPRLAAFARRFPAVHLRVASENTERIVEGVASGRFGLGLIEGPPLSREVRVGRRPSPTASLLQHCKPNPKPHPAGGRDFSPSPTASHFNTANPTQSPTQRGDVTSVRPQQPPYFNTANPTQSPTQRGT